MWDGAGYPSACKAARPPANMAPVTLPPYSPELNPVERRGLYLREHHGANRTYRDLAAPEEAAVAGWRAVGLDPDKIQTVCRCEYATGS